MKIFSAQQIRDWDQFTINHEPIASIDLMERAATACTEWLLRQYPDWEWAECDRNRLVWAENGCIFAANLDRETGVSSPKLLRDFNDMKFEARAAPY